MTVADCYCVTGVDSDLREAARSAVRDMIQFLCAEHQLNKVDAYMLCSVAGDLRIHEAVCGRIAMTFTNTRVHT